MIHAIPFAVTALSLHNFMTTDELKIYFGTDNPNNTSLLYNVTNLKVILISSEQFNLDVNIFGKNHRFRFEANTNLLAPTVRIRSVKDRDSVRYRNNHNICHFIHNAVDSMATISTCNNSVCFFSPLF